MNVTAKDLATGKEAKIRITASTKLSKEEKERLIKDADQYAEQDKKKREEAELRNNADSLVYTAERTKTDLAGKINPEEVGKIDAAVTELKNALASNDMTQLKAKSDALQKVLQEVGTKVYQQAAAEQAKQQGQQPGQGPEAGAGPQPPPSGGPEGPGYEGPGEEKVVDSEDYKVK
jgi:molecular chaperone DnaK